MKESDTILVRFTHTDDAATAHRNTGFPNVFNRAQPVFVGSGRNDLAIKLRRCVEVMVVSMQPCFRQAPGLRLVQHAKRAADLQAKSRNASNHF